MSETAAELGESACLPTLVECIDDVVRCGGGVPPGSRFYRQCRDGLVRTCMCVDVEPRDGAPDCGPCVALTETEPTTCAYDRARPLAITEEAPDDCEGAPAPTACIDDREHRVEPLCEEPECYGLFRTDRTYLPVPDSDSIEYTALDAGRWALCDDPNAAAPEGFRACRCSDVDPSLTAGGGPRTHRFCYRFRPHTTRQAPAERRCYDGPSCAAAFNQCKRAQDAHERRGGVTAWGCDFSPCGPPGHQSCYSYTPWTTRFAQPQRHCARAPNCRDAIRACNRSRAEREKNATVTRCSTDCIAEGRVSG